jgi:hypothetical protein
MEGKKNGDFLFQEYGVFARTISRRGLDEQHNVGSSAAKGALARRLAKDGNAQNVRWSGAEIQGPIICNGFKVIAVKVDVRTVKLMEPDPVISQPNNELVEAAMVRHISGRASRDDLSLLQKFYAQNGDLLQANRMAEDMLTINIK